MSDFNDILTLADSLRDTTMEARLVRPIVPIREWVVSEYYAGPDIKNLYPYWREHLINIFDESRTPENKINEIIITGCLTGDTIIPLLNGENITIKELADRGTDYEFDVYSVDTNTGNIVAGHGHNARKTGDSRNVYKVTLDNGEVVYATENHPFLMRDLTYKRLDELEFGDSLYPFNRHLGSDGYTNHQVVSIEFVRKDEVYDIEVDDFHNFALESGCFVHNSIGTGKTTFANFVMLRFLYEISCYDNPQALFNLMMTSKIAFFYFNITKEQANLTGYGQLREMIDASPYFREYFKRNERKSNDIEWLQQKMYISYGSSTGHIIGTNLLGSILDEANFYQGDGGSATVSSNKDVQSKAAKIYTNIINRRKISLLKKWCFANIINYRFIFNV